MRRRLLIGVLAIASVMPIAVSTTLAAAAASKTSQTAHCVGGVVKRTKVTMSAIRVCEGSSVKVSHPCPKGSSTIFVVVHHQNYALRVGHKPEHLAKQFGMGTISQSCGHSTPSATVPSTAAPVAPPPTTTTTVPPPPPPTTVPPPPPTTAAPASCHPLTDGGNCYEPGEFCRDSDHGATGVAGDGETITCENNDGWRWEPT